MKLTYNLPPEGADDSARTGPEPLIGVGSWPGAVSSYLLTGDETRRALAVTLASHCDYGLPGPADPPADAARRAVEQGERYRVIRSQLRDPGLAVSLLSTLHPGLVLPVADGASSLRRHAEAAELFALAGTTATPPTLSGIATLGELLDRYGLSARGVAAANADLPLSSLLAAGQTLTVPGGDSEAGGGSEPDGGSQPSGGSEPEMVGSDTLAEMADRLSSTPERLLQDNLSLQLAAEPAFVLPGVVTLPAEARTPYSVQAEDTLAALARRFATTPRALVTANADRSGALPAGIRIEVSVSEPETPDTDETSETDKAEPPDTHEPETPDTKTATASTDTLAGDSFQAVCDRLVQQHAGVTLDAVADAFALLSVPLVAGAVLSCPLAVLGGDDPDGADPDGADPDDVVRDDVAPEGGTPAGGTVLTALEVQARYGCPPAAFAAANAALLGVLQPGVELSLSGATTVTAPCDTLNAVLGRLTSAGAPASIAQLMSENASTPLFRAGARALLPPPSVTLTASTDQAVTLAAPASRLAVTIRLERPGSKPAPDAAPPGTDSVDSTVPPPTRDGWQQSDPPPFDAFVDACLAALPSVRLATDANGELWAVSFGSDGIASVRIEPSAGGALGPRLFALRLLYQSPIDFDAWIKPVTDHGSLGTPVLRQYHGMSVEPWARSFLIDLDRYLSPPLSARLPDAARERLAELRQVLATAIAGGLTPLLRAEPDAPGLLSARAALTGIARGNLTSAYASALAQYRAVVVSPYGRDGLPAARLHGTVTAPGQAGLALSESRTELAQSESWCAVALTGTDPSGATTVSLRPDQVFSALELDSPGPGTPSAEPVLLRFVRPLAGGYRPEAISAELPPADVPLPLRQHPEPPGNLTSTATPTFTGPGQPTLAEAAQWTAGVGYTHEHAAQDVVRVSIPQTLQLDPRTGEASDSPAGAGMASDSPAEVGPASGDTAPASPAGGATALAEALAAYVDAAGVLARLIGAGVQPVGSGARPADADAAAVRDNAAVSLVELAGAVATAWAGHWLDHPPADAESADAQPADADAIGWCRLRAVYATAPDGRRLLDRLVVSLDDAEDPWPLITLVSGDEQAPLTPGPVVAGARNYAAAEHPGVPGPLRLLLDWPGLRGAPLPDAQVSVAVKRNPALQAGTPTSPALVLRTPVSQLDVARPAVRWSERLPLAGATLTEALQNAFDELFGEQPNAFRKFFRGQPVGWRLRIAVRYASPIGGSGAATDLWTVLSALLAELLLGPDAAATLAASMERWRQEVKPPTAGAEWRLGVTLLSDEPPLLAFDELVFPVTPGSQPG